MVRVETLPKRLMKNTLFNLHEILKKNQFKAIAIDFIPEIQIDLLLQQAELKNMTPLKRQLLINLTNHQQLKSKLSETLMFMRSPSNMK